MTSHSGVHDQVNVYLNLPNTITLLLLLQVRRHVYVSCISLYLIWVLSSQHSSLTTCRITGLRNGLQCFRRISHADWLIWPTPLLIPCHPGISCSWPSRDSQSSPFLWWLVNIHYYAYYTLYASLCIMRIIMHNMQEIIIGYVFSHILYICIQFYIIHNR